MNKQQIISNYVNNLNEEAKTIALKQLMFYPEAAEYILKCAEEFDRFYNFPIK